MRALLLVLFVALVRGQLWGVAQHWHAANETQDTPCIGALVQYRGRITFLTTGVCIAQHHGTGQRFVVRMGGASFVGVGQTEFRLELPAAPDNLNVGFLLLIDEGEQDLPVQEVFQLPQEHFSKLYPPAQAKHKDYSSLRVVPDNNNHHCRVMRAVAIQDQMRVLLDCALRSEGTLLVHGQDTLYGLMSYEQRPAKPESSQSFVRLDTPEFHALWRRMELIATRAAT
jgi:hypothetical protein